MEEHTLMDIEEIKIPECFKSTCPKEGKINKVREYINTFGEIDIPIILNANKYLVDGYTRYLAAKEAGINAIPCKMRVANTYDLHRYITGVHSWGRKVYTWKVPDGINVQVGDIVVTNIRNKSGRKVRTVAKVTSVFTTEDKSFYKHKPILKVLK